QTESTKDRTKADPQLDGGVQGGDDLDDVREGETPEDALQRRIAEGKIGKGRNVRKWRDTEEKQRRVETGRYQSRVRRYGKIYEEVKALRQETRHSVQDLRERFKDKGVIQNKDQFIVRLIAQERTEQEGKVAAIKSLQQWRLTDVELHNFLNRCHKRGLAGKLELAKQWVFEQGAAGGDVTFKEGLAFYSSIGILQPRSSAQTQQQWREWREWEDAMTAALDEQKLRKGGGSTEDGAGPIVPDASCNEDSTVCNSPWSSEPGGSGSFAGFSGNLRSSSAHGEGDVAGGYGSVGFRSSSGTASEASKESARVTRGRGQNPPSGNSPKQKDWSAPEVSKEGARVTRGRGQNPPSGDPPKQNDRSMWGFLSPSSGSRPKSLDAPRTNVSVEQRAVAFQPVANGKVVGGSNKISLSLAAESVVRSAGGYLPPRHPLAALQLSPARLTNINTLGAMHNVSYLFGENDDPSSATGPSESANVAIKSASGALGLSSANGTAVSTSGAIKAEGGATVNDEIDEGPAPTEELGIANRSSWRRRRLATSYGDGSRTVSGVLSEFADWLVPGSDSAKSNRHSNGESKELLMEIYPRAPSSPPSHGATKSAPATPRGRPKPSSVLRGGGWFYNGDSDYSSSEEAESVASEDVGFWADAGTTEPPRHLGGGGGESILDRLRKLFT
ncbi:unnamed protein product, partial [Ascophyllum nodosum]